MARCTQQNSELPDEGQRYSSREDEIDLLVILQAFVRDKYLILFVTLLCTMLAVGISVKLPKEFRAKVIMLPPLAETVEKLNIPNVGDARERYFFEVDPEGLYHNLIENLQSSRLRRQFFDEGKLFNLLSDTEGNSLPGILFDEMFSKKMMVSGIENNKEKKGFVTITLDGKNPEQIQDWLNGFVKLVDQKTISEQTQLFLIKVQRVRDSVLQRIESLRSIEHARRLDTIARLEEAVVIAEKLGWIDRPGIPKILYEEVKTSDVDNMSFSLQKVPLYLRGAKALRAEISVLQKRKDVDPFIRDLRKLQEQHDFLVSVKQAVGNVHAMRIDRPAIVDNRPIKPNKKIIVMLGFVVGILLSVFMVFVRNVNWSDKDPVSLIPKNL